MSDWAIHFGTVFMAFFAIMNPIANAPIFVGLCEELDPDERRQVALRAILLSFGIVAGFALLGREIFAVFGITLPAFQIAGGLIVAIVGYHMLQGQHSPVHAPRAADIAGSRDAALGIAISPLALPVLAGPGTIATAMNFAAQASGSELASVLAAFALDCILTWICFAASGSLIRFLGQHAISVVTRLMGLILAVIGVQMVVAGTRAAIGAG